ncbi:MAG: signal recognition particle protein [Myxococcota bacterium]
MLETLTRGFRTARDQLLGAAELSDENTAEALRAVRVSLLEADVDLEIVRGFLDRVRERCAGERVKLRAGRGARRMRVSPGDHFTRACYDELVALMGAEEPIGRTRGARAVMLLGLQGTGKTSTAAKLALHLKKQGERPLLVAADLRRPAAREQLRVLGESIGVEVFSRETNDAPALCAEALDHARSRGMDSAILDTAGRLQIDDALMRELAEISERVEPELQLLVCDAMAGREAVHVAEGFGSRMRLDGLILTKLDGDARGGAALAIRHVTGVPIRCITTGEAPDRLESFRPEGLASRILGMGDVVGLVRDFEEVVDEDEAAQAERDAERMLRGKFTLEDFLSQLRMLQRMGPLGELVQKLPGAGDLMPEGAQVEPRELARIEAMILSMTPEERRRPERIDASRARRVARGSGTAREEVDQMLGRFRTMRKLLGNLGKGGLLSRLGGLGPFAGGGGPGLDPAALAAGGPPNRQAARAQQAQQRRKQRKHQRRHKRRGKRR